MSEQTGAKIREARTAAGMTQKELAEAVDGLSAKSISEAERGLRELTDEQLAAIAEATGAESLLPSTEESVPPAAPEPAEPELAASEEAVAVPAASDNAILELFSAATPAVKEATMSVLKGETPMGKGILDGVLPVVLQMMGSDPGTDPLTAIIGFLASERGKAFLDNIKGALGSVAGMFAREGATGEDQDGRRLLGSLLVFTFSYAVAIYVLLLSFYFWLIRTDIKPEK